MGFYLSGVATLCGNSKCELVCVLLLFRAEFWWSIKIGEGHIWECAVYAHTAPVAPRELLGSPDTCIMTNRTHFMAGYTVHLFLPEKHPEAKDRDWINENDPDFTWRSSRDVRNRLGFYPTWNKSFISSDISCILFTLAFRNNRGEHTQIWDRTLEIKQKGKKILPDKGFSWRCIYLKGDRMI